MLPGSPFHPDGFRQTFTDGYLTGLLCIACFRPTEDFFIVAGTKDFYLKTLGSLGAIPEGALLIAARNHGSLGDIPAWRVTVCADCARARGYDRPANYRNLKLLGTGTVPVKFLADTPSTADKVTAFLRRETELNERKQAKEMRIKGAQKDIAEYLQTLEKQGYAIRADNRSGHIKVFDKEDRQYIMTVSMTPRSARRTLFNVQGTMQRWERAHPEVIEENMRTEGAEEKSSSRRGAYLVRSMFEKAAIVTRYDDAATLEERRAVLAKEHTRHDQIRQWRDQLRKAGWNIPVEPAELPDEPERTQMCMTCAQDKALTAENWTQYRDGGRYYRSGECNECLDRKDEEPGDRTYIRGLPREASPSEDPFRSDIQPAKSIPEIPAELTEEDDTPLTESETARVVRLMGRQREIKARLGEIDGERARLTARLDEEKERLSRELNDVQTELFDAVTG